MAEEKPDTARFALGDVPAALGLLTRLPITVDHDRATTRGARAVWAYPLAGLVVGAIAAAIGGAALWVGLPATLAAGLVLAGLVVATGAMHEDGLADCADGFWGGWDRDRRLEIMKDSRIGAYGVIALVLGLVMRWAGLVAVIEAGQLWAAIIIAATSSRAGMGAIMATLPHARDSGLSAAVGRPDALAAGAGVGIAAAVILLIWPSAFVPLAIVFLGTVAGCAALARAKIGGQTGDVIGATQQICEIAVWAVLSVIVA